MKQCKDAVKRAVELKITEEQLNTPLTPMEVRQGVELVTDIAYDIIKQESDITDKASVNKAFQDFFKNSFEKETSEILKDMWIALVKYKDARKGYEVKEKFMKLYKLINDPTSTAFKRAVQLEFNKRDFNISISDITYDENNVESWQVDINGVDQYSKLSQLLKVELASVKQMEFKGEQLVPKLGFLGNEVRYPLGVVFSRLIDKLGNSQDPDVYELRIKENMNDPIIANLFNPDKNPIELEKLKNDIFRHIAQMQKWEYLDGVHYKRNTPEGVQTVSNVFNPSDNNKENQAKKKVSTYLQLMGKLNNQKDYQKLVSDLDTNNYQTALRVFKSYGIIPDNVNTVDETLVLEIKNDLVRDIKANRDVFGIYKSQAGVSYNRIIDLIVNNSPMSISLSHNNQDGKRVYEVNKPNFLARLTNTLSYAKRLPSVAERYSSIINDKIIKKLPVFKQILSGRVRPVIFNSIKQVGEQKGTEYSSMNLKQLMLQQLTMFIKSPRSIATIANAIHSDAGIQTGMRLPIRTLAGRQPNGTNGRLRSDELLEHLENLAIIEREMVMSRDDIQIKNDHIIFPFLKDKDISQFKQLIEKELRKSADEYFYKAEDLGIIQRTEEGNVVWENNMFNNEPVMDAIYDFVGHHLLYNSQLAIIYNGDPSYYGEIDYSRKEGDRAGLKKNSGTPTYFKRTKQIWSPLQYLRVGASYTNQKGETFTVGETFNTVVLKEIELETSLTNFLKENYPEYIKSGKFNSISLTDAQSYIDPIRFKQQMIGNAEWNDEWEQSLDAILEGRFNVDNAKLYGPQKPFYFHMHNVNGRAVPFQNKDSEFIIQPVFGLETINNKPNPLFNPMHKWMLTKMGYTFTEDSFTAPNQQDRFLGHKDGQPLIDKFTFDSAVKVGNQESYDTNSVDTSNTVEQQAANILEEYLAKFGISVEDINNLKGNNLDELGIADILSKIAYIKDRKDLPPVAGKFIAYMMQYNPLVSNIVKKLAESKGEYKKEHSAIYFVGSGLGKSTLAKSNPEQFKDMDALIKRALKSLYPNKSFSQKEASELIWNDKKLQDKLKSLIGKYKETHIILSPLNKNKLKTLGYSYSGYYVSGNSAKTVKDISSRKENAYNISEEEYNKLYIEPYSNEKNLTEVSGYLSDEFNNLGKGKSILEFADNVFTKDNYKDLDKDKYLTSVGKMISEGLKNKLSRSNSFFSKVKQIIKEFFSLNIGSDVLAIQANINKIVEGVISQNKNMITASKFKPGAAGKEVSQVNIEDALNKDAFGKNIIERLSKYKFILTGSTALSEQGTIMRPDENPLHDIDWISPYQRSKTIELFLQEFPEAVKVRDIISEDYITDTYITPPDGHKISNLDMVDYNGRIIVNGYDVVDSSGSVVGTYRFKKPQGETRKKEVVTGVEAKLIDFFSPNNESISGEPYEYVSKEGFSIYLANWKSTFSAKLEFARIKDIWDYNRFIPNTFVNKIDQFISFSDNIKSNQRTKGAAKSVGNQIILDRNYLKEKFDKKAWTNPRELSEVIRGKEVKSFVKALPKDQFKTYKEWELFVINHEYYHKQLTKNKFYEDNPNATLGDYESKINDLALDNPLSLIEIANNLLAKALPIVQMNNSAYGKQGEVPNHILDDEQKMAVQVRKNIIKDINKDKQYIAPDWYEGDMISGRDLIKEFNRLEIENLELDMQAVNQRFNNPNLTQKENMQNLVRMLQETILQRNMDSRFIEFTQLDADGNTALELDHPAFIYQIRQVFNAVYSKKVIQQKLTNGVAYANASPFGFSELPKTVIKNGGIDHYEAYAPVHNSFLKQFINEGEILDYDEMKNRVQEVSGISDNYFDKLVTGMIWRIPNEKVFSNFHIKITKFFPSEMGGSIILPLEMTAFSGADFDIDKMYGFYYNYHTEYGKADINTLLLESTEDELNRLVAKFPNTSEADIIREALQSEEIIQEVDGVQTDVNPYKEVKRWALSKMKRLGKDKKIKPKLVIPYKENTKKGNHNRMMDLMQLIMKQPETATEILKTSDFDVLKKTRDNILEKLELINKPLNPFSAQTHAVVSNRMLVGKQLIGPLANINSIIALLQQGNISLGVPLLFNDNTYTSLSDIEVNGVKPSDTIGNWVAAIVDNGKDPIAGDVNINWATIDTLILLLSAGLDHKTSLTFLNEPIIREYAEYYLNNGGNIQAERKANEKFFGKENPELAELKTLHQPYIVGGNNKNILANFLLYKQIGQQLNVAVTALKVAEGGLGASAGHTMSKLRQVYAGMNLEGDKAPNLLLGVRDLIINKDFVHNKLYNVLADANEFISNTMGIGDYAKGAYRQALDYFSGYKKGTSNLNLTAREIDDLAHHLRMYMLSSEPDFAFNPNIINNLPDLMKSTLDKYPEYKDLLDVLILDKDTKLIKYKGSQTDLGNSSENYREIVRAMVNDDRQDVQEFVKALGIYSFYSDGFGVSPFGFSHLFPVDWYINFLPYGNSSRLSNNEFSKNDLDSFIDQYIRNNYQSLSFIPNAYGMASNKMKNTPNKAGYYKDNNKLFYWNGEKAKQIPTLGRYGEAGFNKISGKLYYAYKYGDTNFTPVSNITKLNKLRRTNQLTQTDYNAAINISKKDFSISIEQILDRVKKDKLDPNNETNNCE